MIYSLKFLSNYCITFMKSILRKNTKEKYNTNIMTLKITLHIFNRIILMQCTFIYINIITWIKDN